jgi:hypothetical protein
VPSIFCRRRASNSSKEVPPELLEEVFELNMALEELRGGDVSARPQLEAARDKVCRDARGIDSDFCLWAGDLVACRS